MKNRFCSLLFIVSLTFLSPTLFAQQDGIQFETIPLSSSSSCNPIIFRGTERYQGLAFIMPRLRMAKSPRGTEAFEFLNLAGGKKVLQLGLYFPKFIVDNHAESIIYEDYAQNQCDYQEIMSEINRGKVKPTDDELEKGKVSKRSEGYVTDIVTLQVKNIGVKVQGVPDKAWATDEDTDILSYQGQVKNIEIPLSTDAQHEDIITRMESGGGLGMNIDFQFKARESNGYCKFTVDLSNIAKQVRSGLNGQYDLSKPVKFPVGKLSAAFGNAVKNSVFSASSKSYCEEGDNSSFQAAYMKLISRYLRPIASHLTNGNAVDPTQNSLFGGNTGFDPTFGIDDPNQGFEQQLGGTPEQQQDPISPIGDVFGPEYGQEPINPGQNQNLPRNLPPTKFSGQGIALQNMLQKLEEQKSFEFVMNSLSKNTIRTFTTSINVFKSSGEPGRTLIRLSSLNNKRNDSGKVLKAGDEIKIYPSYEEIKKYRFEETKIYYSKADLETVRQRHFDKMKLIPKEKVKNQSLLDQTIGVLEEQKWNYNAMTLCKELTEAGVLAFATSCLTKGYALAPVKSYTQYRWGEKNVKRVLSSEVKHSFSAVDKSQSEILTGFKLGLVFNKISPNSVMDIRKLYANRDNYVDYFDIEYDHFQNVFVLNIKQDLGRLFVKNLETTKTESRASKYYFQEVKHWKNNWFMKDQKKVNKFKTTFSGKETLAKQATEVSILSFNIQKAIDQDSDIIPIDIHNESGETGEISPLFGTGE